MTGSGRDVMHLSSNAAARSSSTSPTASSSLSQLLAFSSSLLQNAEHAKAAPSAPGGSSNDNLLTAHLNPCLTSNVSLYPKHRLLLHLHPAHEGYSLHLLLRNGEEVLNLIDKNAYEDDDALLEAIDQQVLPSTLIDLIDSLPVELYLAGCLPVEIRDLRSHSASKGTSLRPLSPSKLVWLRPDVQSMICDSQSLGAEHAEELIKVESEIVKASAQPLCLEPNPVVGILARECSASRHQLCSLGLRRCAKKFSSASINRKRKIESVVLPDNGLISFMQTKRQRPNYEPLQRHQTWARAVMNDKSFTIASDVISSSVPPLSSSTSVVDRLARVVQRRPQVEDVTPILVEEYILETQERSSNNQSLVQQSVLSSRIYHTRLSIYQRVANDEYLGELYVERDFRAESERKGSTCRFSLGTRSQALKYINQFTEIFTEEGRKSVKITHRLPHQPPRVTFTQGMRERMLNMVAASSQQQQHQLQLQPQQQQQQQQHQQQQQQQPQQHQQQPQPTPPPQLQQQQQLQQQSQQQQQQQHVIEVKQRVVNNGKELVTRNKQQATVAKDNGSTPYNLGSDGHQILLATSSKKQVTPATTSILQQQLTGGQQHQQEQNPDQRQKLQHQKQQMKPIQKQQQQTLQQNLPIHPLPLRQEQQNTHNNTAEESEAISAIMQSLMNDTAQFEASSPGDGNQSTTATNNSSGVLQLPQLPTRPIPPASLANAVVIQQSQNNKLVANRVSLQNLLQQVAQQQQKSDTNSIEGRPSMANNNPQLAAQLSRPPVSVLPPTYTQAVQMQQQQAFNTIARSQPQLTNSSNTAQFVLPRTTQQIINRRQSEKISASSENDLNNHHENLQSLLADTHHSGDHSDTTRDSKSVTPNNNNGSSKSSLLERLISGPKSAPPAPVANNIKAEQEITLSSILAKPNQVTSPPKQSPSALLHQLQQPLNNRGRSDQLSPLATRQPLTPKPITPLHSPRTPGNGTSSSNVLASSPAASRYAQRANSLPGTSVLQQQLLQPPKSSAVGQISQHVSSPPMMVVTGLQQQGQHKHQGDLVQVQNGLCSKLPTTVVSLQNLLQSGLVHVTQAKSLQQQQQTPLQNHQQQEHEPPLPSQLMLQPQPQQQDPEQQQKLLIQSHQHKQQLQEQEADQHEQSQRPQSQQNQQQEVQDVHQQRKREQKVDEKLQQQQHEQGHPQQEQQPQVKCQNQDQSKNQAQQQKQDHDTQHQQLQHAQLHPQQQSGMVQLQIPGLASPVTLSVNLSSVNSGQNDTPIQQISQQPVLLTSGGHLTLRTDSKGVGKLIQQGGQGSHPVLLQPASTNGGGALMQLPQQPTTSRNSSQAGQPLFPQNHQGMLKTQILQVRQQQGPQQLVQQRQQTQQQVYLQQHTQQPGVQFVRTSNLPQALSSSPSSKVLSHALKSPPQMNSFNNGSSSQTDQLLAIQMPVANAEFNAKKGPPANAVAPVAGLLNAKIRHQSKQSLK